MAKSNETSSNTSLTEHLSAFLDGEAGDFEQRCVLNELGAGDSNLRKKLSSYSLIGESIRSGAVSSAIADNSFLKGIQDEIDSELETSVSLGEHLSAVLDEEAGDFEQRRVLDELGSNNELLRKVSSYSLIGEAMRTNSASTTVVGSGFLDGIHKQIESQEEYHRVQLVDDKKTNTISHANSWLKPVGGFAMAASVAAIAFIGIQNYKQADTSDFTTASVETTFEKTLTKEKAQVSTVLASADQEQIVSDDIAALTSSYRQADNKTRMLLKRYVDSHMKHASLSAFVPSVRVIAYTD